MTAVELADDAGLDAPAPAAGVHLRPASSDGEVRRRVLGGFAWGMFAAAVMQVAQLLAGLAMVRLLSPREYWLAGMALIFSSLVLMLSDFSMGTALIQRENITEADCSTAFWTSAAIGVLLTLGGLVASGPLASFYGQPEVQPLFAVVSLTFLFAALQTTQNAMLQRDMRFQAQSIRSIGWTVAGNAVGLTAALLGAGAWALVLAQVASTVVSTIMIWMASSWRPRFIFSMRSLRDLGGYGAKLVAASLLTYAKNNADNLLVGRVLGSAALGIYAVAYNLMFVPLNRLIIPIQETIFPALSQWQDDHRRVGMVWLRVLRAIASLLAPAMCGFIVVAPDFVKVVMSPKWHSAVPVLQILAGVALAQAMAMVGSRVLMAVDRPGSVSRFALLDGMLTILAFAIGLQWGIVGVAVCYAVVSVPLQLFYIGMTGRAVGIGLAEVARALGGVAFATASMVMCCAAVELGLKSTPSPLRLGLAVAVGALAYGLGCYVLDPPLIQEVRTLLARRRGGVLATASD